MGEFVCDKGRQGLGADKTTLQSWAEKLLLTGFN